MQITLPFTIDLDDFVNQIAFEGEEQALKLIEEIDLSFMSSEFTEKLILMLVKSLKNDLALFEAKDFSKKIAKILKAE